MQRQSDITSCQHIDCTTLNSLSNPFIWQKSNNTVHTETLWCASANIITLNKFHLNGQFKLLMYFDICPMMLIGDPVVITPILSCLNYTVRGQKRRGEWLFWLYYRYVWHLQRTYTYTQRHVLIHKIGASWREWRHHFTNDWTNDWKIKMIIAMWYY